MKVYFDSMLKQCPVIEARVLIKRSNVPAHLISDAWTFVIGLIVLKIAIILETTWIQRYF